MKHTPSVSRLAEILKAMADPTRLQMLLILFAEPEVCVCEFEDRLGISQSKSSRHLRYMRAAGVVKDRRDGVWVHYRLNDGLEPDVRAAIAGLLGALDQEARATVLAKPEAECCAPAERPDDSDENAIGGGR